MRVTALVLGVLGGVIGLSCGAFAVQLGTQLSQLDRLLGGTRLRSDFGADVVLGAGVLVVGSSILGIVGAGLALGHPRVASLLMLIAAVAGSVLLRADFVLAAALFFAACLLALLSPRPVTRVRDANVVRPAGSSSHAFARERDGSEPERRTYSSRSLLARLAWLIAASLLVLTWWFWLFALLGLVALALLAPAPRYGDLILAATGWRHLPLVGGLRGWRASAVLVVMALSVYAIALTLTPLPG